MRSAVSGRAAAEGSAAPAPAGRPGVSARSGTGFLVSRVLVLAFAAAMAVFAAPPLARAHDWIPLAVLVAATAGVAWVYLSRRRLQLKYLVPGTIFLIAFQVIPVIYTVQIAFTNFGDGHRLSKQGAISAIEAASVTQAPDSPSYSLTVALHDGKIAFLLVKPGSPVVQAGTSKGLSAVPGARISPNGSVLLAPGYQILSVAQAVPYGSAVNALTVPVSGSAGEGIRANGFTAAYLGRASTVYKASCDCMVNTVTGDRYAADNARGMFVDSRGNQLPQGWQVYVGWSNFTRVFTDSSITGSFLGVFVWDVAFAGLTVLGTFAVGCLLAVVMHGWRSRFVRFYRVAIVLPYAMPAFAMVLVWSALLNTNFGLVNSLLHLNVDWLGNPWTARLSVLFVNIWMGAPYMFLVSTGALQAMPDSLDEAARIDGAGPVQRFRLITLPLLLVAVTPLLISSYAFNFNNFNAVYLLTQGGPFPANGSAAGATDLLISYTYRLAFGVSGAEFGFAAAISVFIFLLTGVMAAYMFRRTRRQEEVFA